MPLIRKTFACIFLLFGACLFTSTARAHYQINCLIFDSNFNFIKNMAGKMCLFLDDGSFVQYVDRQGIGYYTSMGDEVWYKRVRLHHQINFSNDKKKLLMMSQDIRKEGGDRIDFPVFHVIDIKTGVEQKKFSTYDHRKLFFAKHLRQSHLRLEDIKDEKGSYHDTLMQFVHANSFYEVPDTFTGPVLDEFKTAGFIMTIVDLGFFVLDKELSKILWHGNLRHRVGRMIHDSQLLASGEVLFFSNEGLKNYPIQSSMHLYNPKTGSFKNVYPLELRRPKRFNFLGLTIEATPAHGPDYSVCCGGVQLTSRGVLYSINSKELGGMAYLVDYKGRLLQKMPFPFIDPRNNRPYRFQQIKEFDLTQFLKNHKL